jgi:tetratricopeptide (TPR) repeat protein
MDPKFEKANEIYFRLGIIYKQQQKYDLSLQCFRYILHNPPRPLTESDIWFQTGHVYEQQKEVKIIFNISGVKKKSELVGCVEKICREKKREIVCIRDCILINKL